MGGAQRHLLTLLSGLRDSYEMDVVYFKDSDLAPQVAGVAERLDQFRLDRFPSPRELWRFVNHVKSRAIRHRAHSSAQSGRLGDAGRPRGGRARDRQLKAQL